MTYVTHKNDHIDIMIVSAFETMAVLKLFSLLAYQTITYYYYDTESNITSLQSGGKTKQLINFFIHSHFKKTFFSSNI